MVGITCSRGKYPSFSMHASSHYIVDKVTASGQLLPRRLVLSASESAIHAISVRDEKLSIVHKLRDVTEVQMMILQ